MSYFRHGILLITKVNENSNRTIMKRLISHFLFPLSSKQGRCRSHRFYLFMGDEGNTLTVMRAIVQNKENLNSHIRGQVMTNLGGEAFYADSNIPAGDQLGLYLKNIPRITSNGRASVEQLSQLADCIEQFSCDQRYSSDPRFLKLCLDYCSFSESPGAMFCYMNAEGIGRDRATFYYHWANFLETTKQVEEAKKVVQKGLQVGAQPTVLLSQLQEDLEQRHPTRPSCPAAHLDPKYGVYVFEDESDEDSVPVFPHHTAMKKENPVVCQQWNLSSGLVREHKLLGTKSSQMQIFEGDSSDGEEIPDSYYHQLLQERGFMPMRSFNPHPKPLVVHRYKVAAVDHHFLNVMYADHGGMTESIASARFAGSGDTEAL